jgi:hypothetical protein
MGLFDSKPTALTSTEMAAGAGKSLGNMFGDIIPDYQSKEQQVVSIMQTVDHSNIEEVKQAYNQILQVSPEAAAEYLTQATEFLDQRTKAATTTSADGKRAKLMDSLRYLQSVTGKTLTEIELGQFLSRSKDTVTVGDQGVVDTAKTVFNSIISERSNDNGQNTSKDEGALIDTTPSQASVDKNLISLSKTLADRKVTDMDVQLTQLERIIKTYEEADGTFRDMPGFSNLEKGIRGEEGARNSMVWEGIISIYRHKNYGTALTATEQANFEKMISGNIIIRDYDVRLFAKLMRKVIDRNHKEVFSGYTPKVVDIYKERMGLGKRAYRPPQTPQELLNDAERSGWSVPQTNRLLFKYFPTYPPIQG